MPTQQTNLRAKTDAAGLGLDFSIALVKDTMDDVLAPVRPNATVAALEGALSDMDATRPPAASTRSVLSLLNRYWSAFQEQRRRQRLRATLWHLSDRELMDIGVSRAEIDCIAAHRAIDRLRDGTAYFCTLSRGVM